MPIQSATASQICGYRIPLCSVLIAFTLLAARPAAAQDPDSPFPAQRPSDPTTQRPNLRSKRTARRRTATR